MGRAAGWQCHPVTLSPCHPQSPTWKLEPIRCRCPTQSHRQGPWSFFGERGEGLSRFPWSLLFWVLCFGLFLYLGAPGLSPHQHSGVGLQGGVVCWGHIGAPGPRSEAGTPWPPSLAPGRRNLADSSGVCLTPLVSAVAQELARAAESKGYHHSLILGSGDTPQGLGSSSRDFVAKPGRN